MKQKHSFVLQRLLLTTFAAFAAISCQSTGGSDDSNPNISQAQLNAFCDPFGAGGTTVPISSFNGLTAQLSYIPDGNSNQYTGVYDFEKKATPINTPVYLSQLNIPTEEFTRGFVANDGTVLKDPQGNILDQYFSLSIQSTIRLTQNDPEGNYQFAILSDDGSILQVDTGSGFQQLINDDGIHPSQLGCAQKSIALTHSSSLPIKLDYFQGPRYNIALVLLWRKVGNQCSWHNDNDSWDFDDDDGAPLNDPDCGKSGNDLYFDYSQYPSVPNQNWQHLLARGWSVVPPQNFYLSGNVPNPCPAPSTRCYSDHFQEPQNSATSSVDLLIVTDATAPALDGYDRVDVANYLQNFASQLPAGVDFQVGVMVGYGASGTLGRLIHNPSVDAVLSSKQFAVSDLQTLLSSNLSSILDNDQDHGELGLYSLSQGITTQLTDNEAKGFFRPNAALAVLFLSDDGDLCSLPQFSYPVCNGLSVSGLLTKLQTLKNGQPLTIDAIVHTTHGLDPAENDMVDDYGAGYIDLVNLAGGHPIGMNIQNRKVTNYAQAMQTVGQHVASVLQPNGSSPLLDAFTLSHSGIDPSTIHVTDGGPTPCPIEWTYDPGKNQVDLSGLGACDPEIEVTYCMPGSSPSPTPSASPTPSITVTPSPSPSPTQTVTPSPSPTPTGCSGLSCPSPSPSSSPTPTGCSGSSCPSPSPSPTQTVTPSPSPSPTQTVTPSPNPSPTQTATPSPNPSPSSSCGGGAFCGGPSPSPSPSASCTGPFCGGGPLGQ